VLDVAPEGLVLRELAPDVSLEQVQAETEPALRIPDKVLPMDVA
jgi:3-oxoacid CoA-transferase subunit B